MTINKKRIDYLDIAKGIGIILLIIGHNTYGVLHNFIYLFHMPLFLFISGINLKKDGKVIDTKLIITYIIYSLIFIIFGFWHYGADYSLSSFYETIAYTVSTYGISVLWFLSTLLYTKLIVNIVNKITNTKYEICSIFVIYTFGFIVGYFLTSIDYNFNILYLLIYSISRSFVLTPFVYIGSKSKEIIEKIFNKYDTNKMVSIIFLIIVLVALLFISNYIDIDYHRLCFGIYGVNIILGLLGTLLVIIISKQFEKTLYLKKVLIWCGKYSLAIMLSEYFKFKKYLYDFTYPISVNFDEYLSNIVSMKVHVPIHIPLYLLCIFIFSKYIYTNIGKIINLINKKLLCNNKTN